MVIYTTGKIVMMFSGNSFLIFNAKDVLESGKNCFPEHAMGWNVEWDNGSKYF